MKSILKYPGGKWALNVLSCTIDELYRKTRNGA